MVYKKYIKKDGKLYGPYIYESKRIGGKVVSEYHGPKKAFNLRKFAWIFVSSVFILSLAYFLSTFDFTSLTGEAILRTEVNYTSNHPINGNLLLTLKQGELIPASSKLVLENSEQIYEYDLNSLVSNQLVSGDFYIEGVSLSGSGEGYGIEGQRTVYPEVEFILDIYPINQTPPTPPAENASTENVTNESVNESGNEAEINITEQISNESASSSENESITENANESVQENPAANETGGTSETSPVTGFFARVYNFFLSLTPTGKAISEPTEITGKTSFNNPFIYEITGGEGVQLKQGSVSVSGANISDDSVKVKIEGNRIIVETFYSEIEKGFGDEFSGEGSETLNVNLSGLGLVLNDGELVTKIVYESDEIISSKLVLGAGKITSVIENISNVTMMNVTVEQPLNQTEINQTQINIIFGQNEPQIITAESAKYILTENEKALLLEEFGENLVIRTTAPEIINGRLIGKYELGNQWIGYSYDSNLAQKDLEYQISLDRMKWLKDLANRPGLKKIQASETA